MTGLAALAPAPPNGLPIRSYDGSLFPVASHLVLQAFRQRFRVDPLEYSPKRVAVQYPVGQREEGPQPLLSLSSEHLHIDEVFPVADQGAQSYDEDVFQSVADIPPGLFASGLPSSPGILSVFPSLYFIIFNFSFYRISSPFARTLPEL